MMKITAEHRERIKRELKAAGVTPYGMIKFSIRYLPNIIHQDEHIGGAVYGRYRDKSGATSLNEGMLVATDRRILFLDHKPGYTASDELIYAVVSGVDKTSAGFVAVTLHTRVGDYIVRFANSKCADIFIRYVESRRLEETAQVTSNVSADSGKGGDALGGNFSGGALVFLKEHELAVLSTVDRMGNVHGAVVYYFPFSEEELYILTKDATQKARDIFARGQIALTVYDALTTQTLQIQGVAEVETDNTRRQLVFSEIVKPRAYLGGRQLPPVTKLREGAFVAVKIKPTSVKFREY